MGRIQIVALQRAQLFAAEPSIVGERQHEAIAQGVGPGDAQDGLPLLVSRDPREFGVAGHEPFLALSAEAPRGRVVATANRIGLAAAFLNEVVVKQAHRNQALLDGGIGQASASCSCWSL